MTHLPKRQMRFFFHLDMFLLMFLHLFIQYYFFHGFAFILYCIYFYISAFRCSDFVNIVDIRTLKVNIR